MLQRLGSLMAAMPYKIYRAMKGPDPLHPDFRIVWVYDEELTWFQNKDWGPIPDPPYKLGFYFNDLSALNNCPWVCKFGKNLNKDFPQFQYFCVAYGDPALHQSDYGLPAMQEWAMQFDHPSLMTYGGKLLRMLKEE